MAAIATTVAKLGSTAAVTSAGAVGTRTLAGRLRPTWRRVASPTRSKEGPPPARVLLTFYRSRG
jgi:hypothetical protein